MNQEGSHIADSIFLDGEKLFSDLISRRYKWLCLDLDWTILVDNKIEPKILQAIRKLLSNGIPIIISTGRLPKWNQNLFLDLSLSELDNLYVSYSNWWLIVKIVENISYWWLQNLILFELQVDDMTYLFTEISNHPFLRDKLLFEWNKFSSEAHEFWITLQFKDCCRNYFDNVVDVNILSFVHDWLSEKWLSWKHNATIAGGAIDIGPVSLWKWKSLDVIIDILNQNSNTPIDWEQIARIGDMWEKGQNDFEIIWEWKWFSVWTGSSSWKLFDKVGNQICWPKATYQIIELLNFDILSD